MPFPAHLQDKGRSQALGVLIQLPSKSYTLPLDVSSGYDPKELSDNKDRIDLWNLHFLLTCLKHISRTWDYVCILPNPFIKYILHNAFPLKGSLCDLSITIPTSEEKHWICIILGTILFYNLCVASFSMKLGHMSSMTDVEELSGVFNYLGMWCLLNRDQWSRGVIKFLLYVKAY